METCGVIVAARQRLFAFYPATLRFVSQRHRDAHAAQDRRRSAGDLGVFLISWEKL